MEKQNEIIQPDQPKAEISVAYQKRRQVIDELTVKDQEKSQAISELTAGNQERDWTISELTSSISRMQQELALLRDEIFGPKSEKTKVTEGQMSLDLQVEQFLPETIGWQTEENTDTHK